jgi:hypothetical protein
MSTNTSGQQVTLATFKRFCIAACSKRLDREALPGSALSDEELAAIAGSEVPAAYSRLDKELSR